MVNAEMRRVLIVPGPVFKVLPDTVHPLAVSPDAATGAFAGLGATMAESNMRSPWNPIRLKPELIDVDVIG